MASSTRRQSQKKPTRDGKRAHKDSFKEQLMEFDERPERVKKAPTILTPKKPEKMEEGLAEMIWGPAKT